MARKSPLKAHSLIVALVFASVPFASRAWADCVSPQTFTVGTTADDGSTDSLRFLVGSASVQDCDVIEVPAGTYVLDPTPPGYIVVDKSITIRGAGLDQTVIDANGALTNGGVFAVDIGLTGATLTLEGMTLQNGGDSAIVVTGAGGLHVSDSLIVGNKAISDGGGINVVAGGSNLISVDNTRLEDNEAVGLGGAINVNAPGAQLLIGGGSVISGNKAASCAVVLQATGSVGGTARVSDSRIVNNEGTSTCGGLVVAAAPVTIVNTEISGNKATEYAGAAFQDTVARIERSTISANEALTGNCAGVGIVTSPVTGLGRLEIVDSVVDGNRAAQSGGGVCGGVNSDPADVVIERSTISNNLADSDSTNDGGAGGMAVLGSLSLSDSWVHDNTANGLTVTGGGGIIVEGLLSVERSLIEKNAAVNSSGGGIVLGGVGEIRDSTIVNNTATGDDGANDVPGGGVMVASGGTLTIANSSVVGNEADGSGGGLVTQGAVIVLLNSTVAHNVADANAGGVGAGGDGGGFFNTGVITVTDSIVGANEDRSAGSESPDCFSDSGSSFIVNLSSNNILQSTDGCDVIGQENPPLEVDPLFDPAGLADNDGPIVGASAASTVLTTLALQAGSPAIDSGFSVSCLPEDERGVARPLDGDGDGEAACDLGAFEVPEPSSGTTGGDTTGGETTGGTTGGDSEDSGGCSLIR